MVNWLRSNQRYVKINIYIEARELNGNDINKKKLNFQITFWKDLHYVQLFTWDSFGVVYRYLGFHRN